MSVRVCRPKSLSKSCFRRPPLLFKDYTPARERERAVCYKRVDPCTGDGDEWLPPAARHTSLHCCSIQTETTSRRYNNRSTRLSLPTTSDQPNSRFHAVTFSVKLAFFREKRLFPWNPWLFCEFWPFYFHLWRFKSFIGSICADLLFATCHTWALDCLVSWLYFYM